MGKLTAMQRDTLMRVLADDRRIELLEELNTVQGSVSLDTLAEDRMDKVELHHVHLPTLNEVDAVVYERRAHMVAQGERFGDAVDLLETVGGRSFRGVA